MGVAPLRGLRVLEFSHAVMGPTAGLILAELGADVVKVEPAPDGDRTRRLAGFAAGFFAALNRSKRSIAIDLKADDGQAVLHQLAAQADVVVENYGPGTMDRLGCGYDTLSAANPALVYLALKGYLPGPYETRPALDEVVQHQSGLSYMTGPSGQPLRAGASIIDILGAAFGVIAVQAALHDRQETGRGQKVGAGLFESAAFLMATHMAGEAATGEAPPPMPERRGAWAVYDVFDTRDGEQIFIGVTSDQQWRRFTAQFGLDDLAGDERLASNESRIPHRPWLLPALQAVVAELDLAEVQDGCIAAEISWAPIGRPSDLFNDAHLIAEGGLVDVLIEQIGTGQFATHKLPALPIAFGDTGKRPELTRQAPGVGADTRAVLLDAGLDDARIDGLIADGVIVA